MKFQTTPAFDRDVKRLPSQHRKKFRDFVGSFNAAAQRAAAGEDKPWPNAMRVKTVKGAEHVWEVTWSKNDPDGRATWEWTQIGEERGIRWRRVGDHSVLDNS